MFNTDTTTLSGFEASAGTEGKEQRKNKVITLMARKGGTRVRLGPVLESLHPKETQLKKSNFQDQHRAL